MSATIDLSLRWQVVEGDCLAVMPTLPEACVDAVVTDPPYGLAFMGKAWDHGVPGVPFWVEALRVARPGAHLLAFGGTRTFHRLTCAIEDAGWEVRDCLSWLYGSGFPKSHNGPWGGTALKPAWEPIIMARKPLIGTVAANHAAHGTGALNVDACRIATDDTLRDRGPNGNAAWRRMEGREDLPVRPPMEQHPLGRWPANVVLDEEAARLLDEQSGDVGGAGGATSGVNALGQDSGWNAHANRPTAIERISDSGGASRFFYTAKASRSEREAGLTGEAKPVLIGAEGHKINPMTGREVVDIPRRNTHPTVKPVDLMRWCVRLVTPLGGLVLDPFAGSGTTGIAANEEGCRSIMIERERDYAEIARARVGHSASQGSLGLGVGP